LKIAQTPPIQKPDVRPPLFDPGVGQPPSREPLPQPEIEPLPPPEQLLPPSPTTPTPPGDVPPIEAPQTIRVNRFVITGSTVFSEQELMAAIAKVIGPLGPEGRNVSLAELFQARSAITDYYTSRGYITSGAFIPPQKLQNGVVEIRVLEGSLEDIRVTGLKRLNPGYIASRIAIATRAPLNRDLLQALQLLQLNPLVASISAELSAGSRPGNSLLEVRVTEARSAFATFTIDNQRVPGVGSVRGQLWGTEANLLGFGDAISLSFTKTQGSNALDFSYTVPLSPYDTTLAFSAGFSNSQVIEVPFDILNIQSESYYLELTGRQPIICTPTQEFALGLTLSTRRTRTTLFLDKRLPFPSLGTDAEGQTKASVIRFFQEYTTRKSLSVFAVRSQFNLGVEALGATVNESPPDTQFFPWRGQAQWVRLLAPDTILLVRGDLQLADRPLLPIEQFGIGGFLSVRGYR
ncbi:ShlB/FhaC/HecB family hemolysin secretion/activation protein, partial [Leptodesmis sp.]|uniref:ShlB/FhaC/HecB family hemolysin secretion/activation protein n=1 Tax=Leptodesmis sp. TaxID=3100501 RepID=UPI0040534F8C